MFYLISQYAGWLLVALAIGVVVGWATCASPPQPRRWGWLPVGLAIALMALLLTVFRFINGLGALWVESGLLMFAFYMGGCCLGCWLRQAFPRQAEPPMPQWVTIAGSPSDVPVAPPPPKAMAEWVTIPKPTEPEPAEPEPASKRMIEQAPAAQLAARPSEPQAPASMPKVEGEDLIAGSRPLGLAAPRGGRADDLKLIKGIGRQNEERLHGLGVWHFDQIAAWSQENIDWVGSYLAFPGRIEREQWVRQAADLARGGETEFSRRVKRGEVPTSLDETGKG